MQHGWRKKSCLLTAIPGNPPLHCPLLQLSMPCQQLLHRQRTSQAAGWQPGACSISRYMPDMRGQLSVKLCYDMRAQAAQLMAALGCQAARHCTTPSRRPAATPPVLSCMLCTNSTCQQQQQPHWSVHCTVHVSILLLQRLRHYVWQHSASHQPMQLKLIQCPNAQNNL